MELVLTNNNGTTTMTSLQLVDFINQLRKQESPLDYTELLHKDFMGKIPKVLKAAAIQFATAFYEVNNAKRERQIAIFEKREAMLMAMSYSYDVQAMVYDAWEIAEKALLQSSVISLPNFLNPAEAAKAWAVEYEQKVESQKQLAIAQDMVEEALPKVEFFDQVAEASNVLKMGAAASLLNMGRTKFMKFLKENKYLQYDNRPYAQYDIHGAGYFTTKSHYVMGTNELAYTSYVTTKGLQYLQKKLAK